MSPNTQIFIARKRSLGQGNIFTDVCHSVHGRGVASQRASQGVCIHGRLGRSPPQYYWNTTDYRRQTGGTHPTRIHSCFVVYRHKLICTKIIELDVQTSTTIFYLLNPVCPFILIVPEFSVQLPTSFSFFI